MIFHVIRADILLVARIFLAPAELGKIRTQLVKYPPVLHEKLSNKIYRSLSFFNDFFHNNPPPFFQDKLSIYFSRNNSMLIKTQYRRTDLASASVFHTYGNLSPTH